MISIAAMASEIDPFSLAVPEQCYCFAREGVSVGLFRMESRGRLVLGGDRRSTGVSPISRQAAAVRISANVTRLSRCLISSVAGSLLADRRQSRV